MSEDRGKLERELIRLVKLTRYDEDADVMLRALDAIGAARRAIRGAVEYCERCGGTGRSGVVWMDKPAEGDDPPVKLACTRCLFLRKALAKLEGGES